jgi:hypothetical protein
MPAADHEEITMHEREADRIARLIEWHTSGLRPSGWPQAADPQLDGADGSASDAVADGAADELARAIA